MAASDRQAIPASDRQAAAAWLREHLPTVAAFAAGLKAELGDVRLVWAKENGFEIGRRD
jgi:hypothetical protein